MYDAPARTHLCCTLFPSFFDRNSFKTCIMLLHCFSPFILRIERLLRGFVLRLWRRYNWHRFLEGRPSKSSPKCINFLHVLASSASSCFILLAVFLFLSFFCLILAYLRLRSSVLTFIFYQQNYSHFQYCFLRSVLFLLERRA